MSYPSVSQGYASYSLRRSVILKFLPLKPWRTYRLHTRNHRLVFSLHSLESLEVDRFQGGITYDQLTTHSAHKINQCYPSLQPYLDQYKNIHSSSHPSYYLLIDSFIFCFQVFWLYNLSKKASAEPASEGIVNLLYIQKLPNILK